MFILAILIVLFGVMPFIALDMMNAWSVNIFEMVISRNGGGV